MLRRLRIVENDFFPQNNCIYHTVYFIKIRRIGFWRIGTEPSLHCVSEIMHQNWNSIAQNYKDRFWWHVAEIVKRLELHVSTFVWVCFLAFLSFEPDTKNNVNLTWYCASVPTLIRCSFLNMPKQLHKTLNRLNRRRCSTVIPDQKLSFFL